MTKKSSKGGSSASECLDCKQMFTNFSRFFEIRQITRVSNGKDLNFGKNDNKVAIFQLSSTAFSTTRFDDRNDGMIPSSHFIITKSSPEGGSLPP